MVDKQFIYRMNGQDQYDYCNHCERPVMQEDLGGGVCGCEYCKSPCHIEVINVEDEKEITRRDEKNGLYPDKEDIAN